MRNNHYQKRKFCNDVASLVSRFPLTARSTNRKIDTILSLLDRHRKYYPWLYGRYPRKKKKALKKYAPQSDAILRSYYDAVKAIHNSRYGKFLSKPAVRNKIIFNELNLNSFVKRGFEIINNKKEGKNEEKKEV